jgi:hypothetical protein
MARVALSVAAALLLSCSSAPPVGPPAVPPATQPQGQAAHCDPSHAPAPPLQKLTRPDPTPVTVGQMTEEAAAAKRIFDYQRWHDAELLMRRVVDGLTDDDAGNREIAFYHLTIAQYQQGKIDEALVGFGALARDSAHLKHDAALTWLVRIYLTDGDVRALDQLALYVDELGGLCPMSVPACDAQIFALGSAAYHVGNFKRAVYFFREVPQNSPHASDAASCLATSEQRQLGG